MCILIIRVDKISKILILFFNKYNGYQKKAIVESISDRLSVICDIYGKLSTKAKFKRF